MPKIKTGEQITWKEFFKRWGKGIEGITPLQQTKTQIVGTKIMLVGIFFGIVISFMGLKNLWWLLIILTGAFINTTMQLLGSIQKRNLLLNLERGFT